MLTVRLLESEVMASKKRTHLSVERKAEVIKHAKDTGMSVRALAEYFETQVADILKNIKEDHPSWL